MKVGTRVNRIEESEITGATIKEIQDNDALIEYDEGGQGWWPLECLEPLEPPSF